MVWGRKDGQKELVLFILMQTVYLVGYASVYAFIVTYMKALNYSDFACGLTTTAMSLTYVVVQPLSGYICDTFIPSKWYLMMSFALAIPAGFLIWWGAGRGLMIIPAVMLTAVFSYPIPPLMDSWLITLKANKPALDYGLVKGIGTVGYGVTCLVCGKLFATLGFQYMFYIHGGAMALLILLMIRVPQVPCSNKGASAQHQQKLSFGQAVKMLAGNKPYIILMISGTLYQFAARPVNTFLASLVTGAGGSSYHFGIASFVWSMGEFVVMLAVSTLLVRGMSKPFLYAISLFCGLVRLLVVCFEPSLGLIIGSMLIQSLMTGIVTRVFIDYIIDITPKNIAATAAAFGSTITFGCGSVLGNLIHGGIIDRFGMQSSLLLAAAAMALALWIFYTSAIRGMKAKKIFDLKI